MIVLFWDIDGTLLTTKRAGVLALEDACRDVSGRALDLERLESDGLTDHQIAALILERAGLEPRPDMVERFLRRYEAHLPSRLPERQGRVLEGIRELLEYLRDRRPDVHSTLLTGNTAAGAMAKLTYYGLDGFFEDGAFSEGTGPRADIASRALARVRSRMGRRTIEQDRVFVVGDTPHDIACARAIDARAIAVATGRFDEEALRRHDPWTVLARVPVPGRFLEMIDR